MAATPKLPDGITVAATLGAGTIGASWTALFLAAGLDVDVYDVAPDAEATVRSYVANAWPQLTALGLVRPDASQARVRFFAKPEDAVRRAGFIQESVPERLPVKHELFQRIEPVLQPGAIVSSSASGLMVREMQQAWRDPSRLVLGHPFNPPHLIPLVEVLGNERTAPGVIARAKQFYEACGKVTIEVKKEVPGHVANRLQAAIWREAVNLVVEGVASVEDVDKAVAAGPGLRWAIFGPHMVFSLASGNQGLEVFCERYGASLEHWWSTLGAPRLTPEVGRLLREGAEAECAGRSYTELAAERDRKLIALMQALRDA